MTMRHCRQDEDDNGDETMPPMKMIMVMIMVILMMMMMSITTGMSFLFFCFFLINASFLVNAVLYFRLRLSFSRYRVPSTNTLQ